MTLWLRTVLGSHIDFEGSPKIKNGEIEQEITAKLAAAGVPNPCCDVNEDEDGYIGIAIGVRIEIETLYDSDFRHAPIPAVSPEQLLQIRAITDELAASIRANGYTHPVKITDGIAIHATS